MKRFRLWAGIITAVVLALIGVWVAGFVPVENPSDLPKARFLLAMLGILISVATFGKFASWVVRTTTRLMRQITFRIASEVMSQFSRAASRGLSIFPAPREPIELNLEPGKEEGFYLRSARPVIIDTSSIIDARILDVAKTNFLSGLVLIPDFVLTELQQVADSVDSLKRLRGRKGFEVVAALKKLKGLRVEIWEKEVVGKNVDEKILKLAKILKGRILTCDYNLSKVAEVSNLTVLNLNDLSNALKAVYIPGEKLEIKVVSMGKEETQGVGYLMDGTMVVISNGADLVGKSITAEVTKVLQVPAGRMVFGRKV